MKHGPAANAEHFRGAQSQRADLHIHSYGAFGSHPCPSLRRSLIEDLLIRPRCLCSIVGCKRVHWCIGMFDRCRLRALLAWARMTRPPERLNASPTWPLVPGRRSGERFHAHRCRTTRKSVDTAVCGGYFVLQSISRAGPHCIDKEK